MTPVDLRMPAWAEWSPGAPAVGYTLGIEEEVMLLAPRDWSLAAEIDRVLPVLPSHLAGKVSAETHGSALELATGVHETVGSAVGELADQRGALNEALASLDLRAAAAGLHPFALWHDTVISSGERYQFVYGSMRELARREPTFALHIHVGVADPDDAVGLVNRLRGHLPMLLALSANSPFWQGRDTGLASARTPLFGAFPRVGIPRSFGSYADYVEAVDLLIRSDAIPEPTFLWWDVRPQPRFGTVEVRIMDTQTRVEHTAALVALVQCIARLEVEQGYISSRLIGLPEVLHENRFLAARDGINATFIDPDREERVALADQIAELISACRPHAQDLGCESELSGVEDLAAQNGALRQLAQAREADRLPGLVAALVRAF